MTFYPDTLQEENIKFLEESLTIDELKEAFRFDYKYFFILTRQGLSRLFDNLGNGYITVERFGEILKEIDNEMSDEELSKIISDVSRMVTNEVFQMRRPSSLPPVTFLYVRYFKNIFRLTPTIPTQSTLKNLLK